MITYVDTSMLLKLVVDEEGSDRAATIWVASGTVVSVGLITVEARAALAAAARGGRLTAAQHAAAKTELDALVANLHIIEPTDELLARAGELTESEALRGYDAVHLAAALLVGATVFSSADAELCAAADRLGFHIANPLEG